MNASTVIRKTTGKHITIIDLNNFAYYPTQPIGIIIALLRKAGYDVSLISPLNNNVASKPREGREGKKHYWMSRLLTSERAVIRHGLDAVMKVPYVYDSFYKKGQIFKDVKERIDTETDLVLVSSYFQNYNVCKKLGVFLDDKKIPMLVGGPGFNDMSKMNMWLTLQGITGVVASEAESFVVGLVGDLLSGKSISKYPSVYQRNSSQVPTEHILKDLDLIPVPDYSDFPWEKYPEKIIPYTSARGCSWGKCDFCSDVKYVNGRTFRSFTIDRIMDDLQKLSKNHGTSLFAFTDLKLNSNVEVWKGIIENLPKRIADPEWTCSVHVDNRNRNGLDLETLIKAKAAGLKRISFGFESGSQRLLDLMQKGTTVARLQQFIRDTCEAGISLRTTMFVGYPYENAEDLKLTLEFLERNFEYFDRIKLNRFHLNEMAPISDRINSEMKILKATNSLNGFKSYQMVERGEGYDELRREILKTVNRINAQPIRTDASVFEGVM